MMQRAGVLALVSALFLGLVISPGLGVSANPAATPSGAGAKRERAMDRVVHIEEGIIREIPAVPRRCDSLDLKKGKVDIGDCKLYCEQEGQGTPLVLLHGGPGATHHDFHPEFSRARDFARVIYYDQRGCGLSDYQPGKGYTVDQAVDDLDHLRRALGIEQWVVLGHSYGGLLAQCYVLKYPENVKGLILMCASTGLHGESLPSREREFLSPQERNKIDEIHTTPGLSMAQIVYNIHLNGDWKRQNYYKPTREQLAQGALYGWVHDLAPNFNSVMSRFCGAVDLEGAFARCPLPTLILEAKWDMSWNTDKPEQLRKNHPNAKLVLFEASGHSPFEDEPQVFFPLLQEFLSGLPAVPAEKTDRWKSVLTQWREEKKDPLLQAQMTPAESQAIEEYRRLKAKILAGQTYEDASTPLHATLTKLSQAQSGSVREQLTRLDIFRAPLPPEQPRDRSVWPIFAGTNEVQDTFIVAYAQGRWLWLGNLEVNADWRPFRAIAEKEAAQMIARQAARGNRPALPDVSAPPTAAPSGQNRVLSLDGTRSCVRVPNGPALHTFTNAITIEAWCKAASFATENGRINCLLRKNVAEGQENFLLRFRSIQGTPALEMSPGAELGVARVEYAFVPGKWYHLAGVYDGSAVTLYVNGTKVGSQSISGQMSIDDADLYLGRGDPEFSGGEYFQGLLDEIRIWSVARSPQEIQAALNTPLTGKEPGLVAYWTFDNDAAKDQSGHGVDGVLSPEARIGPEPATPAQSPAAQSKAVSPSRLLRELGWGRSSNEKIAAAYNPQWLDQIDDGWLLLKAGFALYDARRYPEALGLFEKMAQRMGSDPHGQAVALIWQGHLLDLMDQRKEAVERYRKAAGLGVSGEQSHDQYGLTYSLNTYPKQRMETPFVRVENGASD